MYLSNSVRAYVRARAPVRANAEKDLEKCLLNGVRVRTCVRTDLAYCALKKNGVWVGEGGKACLSCVGSLLSQRRRRRQIIPRRICHAHHPQLSIQPESLLGNEQPDVRCGSGADVDRG